MIDVGEDDGIQDGKWYDGPALVEVCECTVLVYLGIERLPRFLQLLYSNLARHHYECQSGQVVPSVVLMDAALLVCTMSKEA